MSSLIQEATIKIRQDTASNWGSENPTPLRGEWCYETDTGLVKIGDGSNNWNTLDYYVDIGTAGQVLTSNGEGSAPSMEDAAFKNDGTQNLESKGIDDNASDTAITIDSNNFVTMPNQPAFCVFLNSQQDNVTASGLTIIEFDTETFDQSGDFNTGTYTFTAPITGKYQFNISLLLKDLDENARYYYVKLITSNKDYIGANVESSELKGDPETWGLSFSVLVDMDTADTAYVKLYQREGASQTDVGTHSCFSGYLVA